MVNHLLLIFSLKTDKHSLHSLTVYFSGSITRNLYNGRADYENRIKELKIDFGPGNFCLRDFWATEASFKFIMVTYNLMSLFRHFALSSHNTAM